VRSGNPGDMLVGFGLGAEQERKPRLCGGGARVCNSGGGGGGAVTSQHLHWLIGQVSRTNPSHSSFSCRVGLTSACVLLLPAVGHMQQVLHSMVHFAASLVNHVYAVTGAVDCCLHLADCQTGRQCWQGPGR